MQGIPISSVTLSSQRVDMTDAINAGNRMQAANPLFADGRKLIPSVTASNCPPQSEAEILVLSVRRLLPVV